MNFPPPVSPLIFLGHSARVLQPPPALCAHADPRLRAAEVNPPHQNHRGSLGGVGATRQERGGGGGSQLAPFQIAIVAQRHLSPSGLHSCLRKVQNISPSCLRQASNFSPSCLRKSSQLSRSSTLKLCNDDSERRDFEDERSSALPSFDTPPRASGASPACSSAGSSSWLCSARDLQVSPSHSERISTRVSPPDEQSGSRAQRGASAQMMRAGAVSPIAREWPTADAGIAES